MGQTYSQNRVLCKERLDFPYVFPLLPSTPSVTYAGFTHSSTAMTSTPAINVYVQIPSALADDGRPILDPDNWKWVLLLVFPLNRLRPLLFLHKPYKWLRYCAGISLGTTGTFCNTAASPNINDSFEYDAGLPTKSEDLYFHTTDPEKAQMFPIDPLMVKNPGRSTSGSTTSRRDDFREEVKERDGNVCVVTGLPGDLAYCEAAHLVAHGQGDAVRNSLFCCAWPHAVSYIVH